MSFGAPTKFVPLFIRNSLLKRVFLFFLTKEPKATIGALIFKETLVDYKNESTLGVKIYRRLAYFDPFLGAK